MGLLDGILGGAVGGQQKPSLGNTVAAGVVLALLVKGVRQYQAAHGGASGQDDRSFDPQAQPGGGLGGLLGGLAGGGGGGLMGGLDGMLGGSGGLGGLLGGLGGAGALGALVNRFQQTGHEQQVQSWVSTGQNQPIAPQDVEHALGDQAVGQLQQQTGLPREALLTQLAHELPQAISAATPNGVLPRDDDELHEVARQPAPHG